MRETRVLNAFSKKKKKVNPLLVFLPSLSLLLLLLLLLLFQSARSDVATTFCECFLYRAIKGGEVRDFVREIFLDVGFELSAFCAPGPTLRTRRRVEVVRVVLGARNEKKWHYWKVFRALRLSSLFKKKKKKKRRKKNASRPRAMRDVERSRRWC